MGGARQVFVLPHQVEDILIVFGFVAGENALEVLVGGAENFLPECGQLRDKFLRQRCPEFYKVHNLPPAR